MQSDKGIEAFTKLTTSEYIIHEEGDKRYIQIMIVFHERSVPVKVMSKVPRKSHFLKTDSEYISYTGSCLCYQQGKSVLEPQMLVKY